MLRRMANAIFWGGFFILFSTIVGTAWYMIHEYGEGVGIELVTKELEGPRQAIILRFSHAIRPKSFEGKITLTPNFPFHSEWHEWGRELSLIPEGSWPLDTDIQLFLGSGRSQLFSRTPVQTYTVTGPKYPAVIAIEPAPDATGVVLGVEDPIRVNLDRSARNFFLDFRLNPVVPVVYQNNPEKTQFEILPREAPTAGKKYELEIWAKWRNAPDESYHLLKKTTFTVLPKTPASWNHDLALWTQEAKRFTRPKKSEGKYIDINLSSQTMTLFENGQALDAYIISSGKRGMETPRGEFAIRNKADRPWSRRYSLFMPYWQAITPDGLFGIHELPEWPGGYKEGANHLGTPVSHGCVRLGVGPAKRVYEWTDIGTPVVVY